MTTAGAIRTEVISYDSSKHDFAAVVRDILGVPDLAQLHTFNPDLKYDRLTDVTDQETAYHKKLYDNLDKFLPVYVSFVREFVKPRIGADKLVYQRVPSFRVHLPGNVAVGRFHKDGEYQHGDGEINYWLPVTDAEASNSVWIETEADRGDFAPWKVDYGQVLVFDGVNLNHGNKTNETGRTRVSFDFRVQDAANFRGRQDKSFSAGLEFDVGSYFEVM